MLLRLVHLIDGCWNQAIYVYLFALDLGTASLFSEGQSWNSLWESGGHHLKLVGSRLLVYRDTELEITNHPTRLFLMWVYFLKISIFNPWHQRGTKIELWWNKVIVVLSIWKWNRFLRQNKCWCPFLHTTLHFSLKHSFESIIVPSYLKYCTRSNP